MGKSHLPKLLFLSAFCLRFVGLLILGSNLFMERAIFPAAITMPLHHNRFPLLIGEVDRHRQSGKPLAPNINPITCPVEWASHINTFPACSHRLSSKTACVLLCFCLHNNASFDMVLTRILFRKNGDFCTTFDTLLIRHHFLKKPCAATLFSMQASQKHRTIYVICHNYGFPSISVAVLQQ